MQKKMRQMTFTELEAFLSTPKKVAHPFSAADLDYLSAFIWLDHAYDWVWADRQWDKQTHQDALWTLIGLWCEAKCQGIGDFANGAS